MADALGVHIGPGLVKKKQRSILAFVFLQYMALLNIYVSHRQSTAVVRKMR